jgi:type IV pilus assembly protein PilV
MNKNSGFTLIEVLVSMIILGIGLMGVTRLQLATLQNNNASQYRSVAIQIGSDLYERMRANPDGVLRGDYDHPATTTSDAAYTVASGGPCSASAVCSSTQRSVDDLTDAMNQTKRLLPGGAIISCIDSGTLAEASFNGTTINHQCDGKGTAYAVKVFWLDERSNSAATQSKGTYGVFVSRGTP